MRDIKYDKDQPTGTPVAAPDTATAAAGTPAAPTDGGHTIPDTPDTTDDNAAPFHDTPDPGAAATVTKAVKLDQLVVIKDPDAPVIILFGPSQCGKTMTLIRLTRYLKGQGYKINPIKSFRDAADKDYEAACDGFNELVYKEDAAEATGLISYMLVEVLKNGKRICQILEAPGEYYFNPKDPNKEYPHYMSTILNARNRKIFCVMVEPDWSSQSDCINYAERIGKLKPGLHIRDRIVFVFNKIDRTEFVLRPGEVNLKQAIKEVRDSYPGIFEPFRNVVPVLKTFKPYSCDFVPFQTGDFPTKDGKKLFVAGPEEYPELLWKTIQKNIRG